MVTPHGSRRARRLARSATWLPFVLPRAGGAGAPALHGGADGQRGHAELPVLERHVAEPVWVGFSNYCADARRPHLPARTRQHRLLHRSRPCSCRRSCRCWSRHCSAPASAAAPIFRTLYFMPVIISLAISGLLWAMIFEPNFGILNSFLRAIGLGSWTQLWLADRRTVMPSIIVVSVWQSLGFYLVIYFAAMQGIPTGALRRGEDGQRQRLDRPLLARDRADAAAGDRARGRPQHDQRHQGLRPDLGDDRRRPEPRQRHARHLSLRSSFGAMGSSNPQLGYATAIAIVILVLSADPQRHPDPHRQAHGDRANERRHEHGATRSRRRQRPRWSPGRAVSWRSSQDARST